MFLMLFLLSIYAEITGDYYDGLFWKGKAYFVTGFGIACFSPKEEIFHIPTIGLATLIRTDGENLYIYDQGYGIKIFEYKKQELVLIKELSLEMKVLDFQLYNDCLVVLTPKGLYFINKNTGERIEEESSICGKKIIEKEGYFYLLSPPNQILIFRISQNRKIKIEKKIELKSKINDFSLYKGFLGIGTSKGVRVYYTKTLREIIAFNTPWSVKKILLWKKGNLIVWYDKVGFEIYQIKKGVVKKVKMIKFKDSVYSLVFGVGEIYIGINGGVAVLSLIRKGITKILRRSKGKSITKIGGFLAIAQGEYIKIYNVEKFENKSIIYPRYIRYVDYVTSIGNYLIGVNRRKGVSLFEYKNGKWEPSKYIFLKGELQKPIIKKSYIIVPAGDEGIYILWLCPCGPLTVKYRIQNIGYVKKICIKENKLFILHPDKGIRIIEAPSLETLGIGKVFKIERIKDIEVFNNSLIYILHQDKTLYFFNHKNLSSQKIKLSFLPKKLFAGNKYLYIVDSKNEIHKFSIDFKTRGIINTPGIPLEILEYQNQLYIQDSYSILKLPLNMTMVK